MTSSILKDVDERSRLAGTNKFELLVFRLGTEPSGKREMFGINVFKVREALMMPPVTPMPGAPKHVIGVANIRGQIVPVIDLPGLLGLKPTRLNILLVTEYERSIQGFAVEDVEEIIRLEWSQVLSAEANAVGGMVTSIAKLDADSEETRLALVLDVERVLRDVLPSRVQEAKSTMTRYPLALRPGSVVLAADDSSVARGQIEQVLHILGAPFVMARTGKEAWNKLQEFHHAAMAEGKTVRDKVALLLTDLEMPEMDGFTLTRKVKEDERFRTIPVVIHSSLTGQANEEHARRLGADGYVAKFVADDLGLSLNRVLAIADARNP
jgi:two-component system chemotaxis response regulator CheV